MDRFVELKAFTAVVAAGGFSAAAREVGQTRSALNRQVMALERRLNVQLFNRTTRHVSPTSAGQALYDRAGRILDDLEDLEASVSAVSDEAVGLLRINAPPSFGDIDIAEIVTTFMARHPKIEVALSEDARIVDPVAEGLDVVIRIAEPDEETTLVDHRIVTLDYLACAAPAYVAQYGAPLIPSDLERHRLLALGAGGGRTEWRFEDGDGPIAIPVRPVLTANAMETLRRAAIDGLGVTIMPEFAIRTDLEDGRLVQVLKEFGLPQRMLQVVYPPARHLSAKVRLFTGHVADFCGRQTRQSSNAASRPAQGANGDG